MSRGTNIYFGGGFKGGFLKCFLKQNRLTKWRWYAFKGGKGFGCCIPESEGHGRAWHLFKDRLKRAMQRSDKMTHTENIRYGVPQPVLHPFPLEEGDVKRNSSSVSGCLVFGCWPGLNNNTGTMVFVIISFFINKRSINKRFPRIRWLRSYIAN